MTKTRLEAFSDGVIAILITIMVLEMKAPHSDDPSAHSADLSALVPIVPVLLSYVLSFIYVGIYWNNHHHLFQLVHRVSGRILWANLHLLFWLSLIPFVTAWMGENHFDRVPAAGYGFVLLGSAVAFFILSHALIADHGKDSALAKALGGDFKGRISVLLYAAAIPLALVYSWIAQLIYVGVAIMWLVPDRRIERQIVEHARGARAFGEDPEEQQ